MVMPHPSRQLIGAPHRAAHRRLRGACREAGYCPISAMRGAAHVMALPTRRSRPTLATTAATSRAGYRATPGVLHQAAGPNPVIGYRARSFAGLVVVPRDSLEE